MFSQIKTSKKNKEVVAKLTRRLNLGTENVIARIAFSYSLAQDKKLDVKNLSDSSGKEYSKAVLFGENIDVYLGMISVHYGLYKTDKDLPKYIKMHIDDGLSLINKELEDRPNVDGFDFLIEKISKPLTEI
jgi:DNA sulfur modification protein DndE